MNTRPIAAAIAVVAAVAALGACSSSDDSTSGHEGHDMASMSTSAANASASDSAHNAADVMFAQMMLPHHEQALEMSDILLAKDGVPTDVRALATSIKQAQGPEITQLTSWLTAWGEPTTADMSGHTMDGMVSADDIAKLKDASGPDAAKLYLTQMIAHHEGAVSMAQSQVTGGKNADAVAMARSIVESQTAEITTMKAMLGTS